MKLYVEQDELWPDYIPADWPDTFTFNIEMSEKFVKEYKATYKKLARMRAEITRQIAEQKPR